MTKKRYEVRAHYADGRTIVCGVADVDNPAMMAHDLAVPRAHRADCVEVYANDVLRSTYRKQLREIGTKTMEIVVWVDEP